MVEKREHSGTICGTTRGSIVAGLILALFIAAVLALAADRAPVLPELIQRPF